MHISDLNPETRRKYFPDLKTPNKPKPGLTKSAEDVFVQHCRAYNLPPMTREYKFAADIGRGWRFDFAFIDYRCAIECEGLVIRRVAGELIVGGRHVSPTGFRNDSLKYARAAIMGWAVLRFEQSQVRDGTAIDHAVELLKSRGWK